MNSRTSGQTVAQTSKQQPSATPFAGAAIQRKCACGSHTAAGGECSECAKKKRGLQRQLAIGASGDPLEREADRIADKVLSAPAYSAAGSAPPSIQRYTGQAAEGMDSAPASVAQVLAGAGRPLEPALRQDMEQRFGQDFSQVRVHTDGIADQSARDVDAHAYTVGHNLAFAQGRFAPDTGRGRHLLAHELAHVVQQGGSTAIVQRQTRADLPPRPGRGVPEPGRQPSLPIPDVDNDPTALSEPHCPRIPTNLGNLAPTPPCEKKDGEDIDGTVFWFCTDSDVFSDPADLARLRTSVSGQPSGTRFRLRSYASTEGPGNAQNADLYNRNLSCHRLNRMIRELVNLGVQEQQIDAVSMGPSERFGSGAAARRYNRAAVLQPMPPPQAPRAAATGMTMAQIRDAAKQRIAGGDYPLAADAYFARWSCGRWRTLAEAVARATVLIEGAQTPIGAGSELGTVSGSGANTIVLSPSIAQSADPVGCAANRIADLTFHHFSRPVLSNFEDQHRAGMHLVHLAGFPECRIPLDPMNLHFNSVARPNPVDPYVGFVPRCAGQPLPGPLGSQQGPATMETPPVFTANALTLSGAGGSAVPSGSANPMTVGVEPDAPFEVRAEVNAAGAPASIANFEIGFVQTVMAEEWINTHVDGRRERRRFPLPLRDGPPRSHPLSDPPWFDKNAKQTAVAGVNQVMLTDAPNFRAFRALPDIPSSRFVQSIQVPRPGGGSPVTLERPTFEPRLGPQLPANTAPAEIAAEQSRRNALANNPPDRGHRLLDFNTWVVARRKNPAAPATLGATQFLSGLRLTFRLDANWSAAPNGRVSGSGSYNVAARAASAGDAAAVQLRGATPLDFAGPGGVPLFAEFLDIDDPLPRAQAGGLPFRAYLDAIRQIARPHRTGTVLRGEIIVRVNIETATGRVILDTPDLQRGAIRVLSPGSDSAEIDTPETRAFARTIFPEIRKLVAAPGFAPNEPQTGTMPVAVRLPSLGAP